MAAAATAAAATRSVFVHLLRAGRAEIFHFADGLLRGGRLVGVDGLHGLVSFVVVVVKVEKLG